MWYREVKSRNGGFHPPEFRPVLNQSSDLRSIRVENTAYGKEQNTRSVRSQE
jgi:hypothetical protein